MTAILLLFAVIVSCWKVRCLWLYFQLCLYYMNDIADLWQVYSMQSDISYYTARCMHLGRSLCWDGPGPSGRRTRTEMTQTRLMGMEVHRTGRLDHDLLHPWTWLCFGLKLAEKMNAISLPWWWWITLPPSYSGHRCCYVVAEYVFCSHFASGILYVYSSKFLFISDLLRLQSVMLML